MIVPLYLAETAPPSMRGTLGAFNQLGITIGILMAYVAGLPIAQNPDWFRPMMLFGLIPTGLQFVAMLALPETPRHAVAKHLPDEVVLANLRRLRGDNGNLVDELNEIKVLEGGGG
jgi:MFS family permease